MAYVRVMMIGIVKFKTWAVMVLLRSFCVQSVIVMRVPRRDGRFRTSFKKGRVDHTHAINIRAAKYIGYRTCGTKNAARVEPAL